MCNSKCSVGVHSYHNRESVNCRRQSQVEIPNSKMRQSRHWFIHIKEKNSVDEEHNAYGNGIYIY